MHAYRALMWTHTHTHTCKRILADTKKYGGRRSLWKICIKPMTYMQKASEHTDRNSCIHTSGSQMCQNSETDRMFKQNRGSQVCCAMFAGTYTGRGLGAPPHRKVSEHVLLQKRLPHFSVPSSSGAERRWEGSV